jgi:hypothetical protein
MRWTSARSLLLIIASVHSGAGELAAQKPVAAKERPGVVFVLGGIGGIDPLPLSAQLVLPLAGVPHEIRNHVWTSGFGLLLKDLMDTEHLQRRAKELAEEIARIKMKDQDRPVYLLAKSGGTGLALKTAELLPPETIERIILLNAAVSPGYDLRGALRATKRQILSFYSPYDRIVLDWGTRSFGTIDRVHGPSAGYCGFKRPKDLDAEGESLYGRLVEISWDPSMLLQGYAGGHSGTSLPIFLAVHAAPWLR